MERIAPYGLAYSHCASWPGNRNPPLKPQRAHSLTLSVPLATISTSSRTLDGKGGPSMPPRELSPARKTDGDRDIFDVTSSTRLPAVLRGRSFRMPRPRKCPVKGGYAGHVRAPQMT